MDKETSPWFWPTFIVRNERGEAVGGYLAPKEVIDELERQKRAESLSSETNGTQ